MKIANVITPGAEYVRPDPAYVSPGFEPINYFVDIALGISVEPVRAALKELAYVEAAVRAESEGCGAIFLNNTADYGIDLVRSAVSIPVIGAGEEAVRSAMDQVDQFSLVTVWAPSTEVFYKKTLERNGATERCASIRYVLDEDEAAGYGSANGIKAAIAGQTDAIIGRIVQTCLDSVKRDGADAVMIGCTCMSGLVKLLRAELDVPVICPMEVGYIAAETAARTAAARGPIAPRASSNTLSRVSAAVAAMQAFDGLEDDFAEECGPVCAVVTA